MQILLTGGTGYVGRHVLSQLVAAGHTVTALVRSDASAGQVAQAGAVPVLGDLSDLDWLTEQLRGVDGAIHTAAAGNPEIDEQVDRVVARAAVTAFADTFRPYIHTSGAWVWGDGDDITEDDEFNPPALTAWRRAVEEIVLDSDITATILAPGIVHGLGEGLPGLVSSAPRSPAGALTMLGTGEQHWVTVHVEDLADLYRIVLEQGSGLGYVIGASGDNPTVRELAEAAAGDAGVEPEGPEASRARLGEKFADALMLDQQATGAKARSLGWQPSRPSLVEEMRSGSYAS